MTILKALPLISQDLMKVLERRKKGKYRSEKNRKTVAIADMKDILRNYESEMDTEVEKALVYGLNLAIYNRLSDLTNEEFEEYITSICNILEEYRTDTYKGDIYENTEYEGYHNRTEEFVTNRTEEFVTNRTEEYHDNTEDITRTTRNIHPDCTDETSTTATSTKRTRRISSGMIPYREG